MSGRRRNEIELYGTTFPILGTVRRTAVSPFPPKIVIGDYTKDDNVVNSSWVISDVTGGSGIWQAQLPKDSDRYWWGDLAAMWRILSLNWQIKGPLLWYDASEPFEADRRKILLGPAQLMIPFNELLYITIGADIYRWSESAQYFEKLHFFDGDAISYALFDGFLWIQTLTSLYRYDPTINDWIAYATTPGYALAEWDEKLYRLDTTNTMQWIADAAMTGGWTPNGKLRLPPGYCQQLIPFFNLAGDTVLHAITRVGVYGYDHAAGKFYETPMTFPLSATPGKGAIVWRGELYIPTNEFIYKYNGSTITAVSPNRDDGLPPELRGDIATLVAGHSFYYAVISTKQANVIQAIHMLLFDEVDVATTDPVLFNESSWIDTFPLTATTTTGGIMVSPGAAWHGVVEKVAGTDMGAATVATVQGTFRLWFSDGTGIYYIAQDTGLHNPFQNRTVDYRPDGRIEWGWTAIGFENMDKLALTLEVFAQQVDAENTIDIFVAWDDVDQWEQILHLTESGRVKIALNGTAGKVFRRVRFAVEMHRALNPDEAAAWNLAHPDLPPKVGVPLAEHNTPLMPNMTLSFVRRPPFLWGWDVDIPITGMKAGKTSKDLVERLYEITQQTKEAGILRYRVENSGVWREHQVMITNIQGAEPTGNEVVGRFTVSLVQLDDEDISEWSA